MSDTFYYLTDGLYTLLSVIRIIHQAHAIEGRAADGRLRDQGQQGQGRREGTNEHHRAAAQALQPPIHVSPHRGEVLRPRRHRRRCRTGVKNFFNTMLFSTWLRYI